MTINNYYADRIIDFLKKYAPYVFNKVNKAVVRKHIVLHLEYQTIVVIWDQGEIASVCAFNIQGHTAHIIECVVKPELRFKDLLKKMTLVALSRYPYLKEISFEREVKYKKANKHFINIDRFVNNKIRQEVI